MAGGRHHSIAVSVMGGSFPFSVNIGSHNHVLCHQMMLNIEVYPFSSDTIIMLSSFQFASVKQALGW